MKKLIMIAVMGGILTGCSTEASRMSACESKGVSRDACYIAEQNRQATINAVAEKQDMENAQNVYNSNDTNSSHHHKHNNY
ncbi:hypothetical protein [Citrobacter braakii]|uniref:hypothetical protein n=1 Tax=Citrobacter braakii TaxID=57706 RepID=UPI0037AD774F